MVYQLMIPFIINDSIFIPTGLLKKHDRVVLILVVGTSRQKSLDVISVVIPLNEISELGY